MFHHVSVLFCSGVVAIVLWSSQHIWILDLLKNSLKNLKGSQKPLGPLVVYKAKAIRNLQQNQVILGPQAGVVLLLSCTKKPLVEP